VETFETFTADEIIEFLAEVCDEIVYETEDHEIFVTHSLTCTVGEIQFSCFLNHDEPFFEQVSLLALRSGVDEPYKFCNKFNQGGGVSRAFVYELDPEDELDDPTFHNGQNVMARLFINFGSGLTSDYVTFMFCMWLEDLNDFFELDNDEQNENSESVVMVDIPQSPEFMELPLTERIAVYLSLNTNRTAKEISKVLKFDRHEINSVLYRNRDRFVKSGEQPPRWSVSA
jgi:hypothetical protein